MNAGIKNFDDYDLKEIEKLEKAGLKFTLAKEQEILNNPKTPVVIISDPGYWAYDYCRDKECISNCELCNEAPKVPGYIITWAEYKSSIEKGNLQILKPDRKIYLWTVHKFEIVKFLLSFYGYEIKKDKLFIVNSKIESLSISIEDNMIDIPKVLELAEPAKLSRC